MLKQIVKLMLISTSLCVLSLLSLGAGLVFSQESLTITTYYPSPYGSYNELATNKLAVDVTGVAVPTEYAAMQNGDVHVGRSLIVGAGGGSGFAYDELVGPPDRRPNDGDALIKGNVGIGTPGPDQRLTVKGGGIGFDWNSADKQLYSPADGVLEWMTHDAAGEHAFAVSHQGAKRVYLNTSGNSYFMGGNVGIGTTSPAIHLAIGDTDTGLQQQGDGELALYTNNSERVRIDNVGNVGIGITNPQHALEIGEGRVLQARDLRLAPVPAGAESSGPLRWYTHTSGYYSASYEPTLPAALDFKIKLRTGTMPSEVDKLVLRQNGLIIPAREGIDTTVSNYLQWQSAEAGYYKADYSNWAFKLKVNTGSGEVENLQLTHDGDLKIARHIYAHVATAQKGLCGDVADLGEYIAVSSKGIEPGDVVVIGSEKEGSIKLSSQEYDKRLVGIISTNPSISLNGPQEKSRPLALAGIVPTKVTTINGSIKRGDPLTSSNIPGYAMKATKSGPIVGKALEDFDGVKGNKGKILVFVNVSWWQPEEEREAIKVLKHQIEDLKKQIASLTQNR